MYEHVIERIQQSVSTNDEGCWIWNRRRDRHGYGDLRMTGLPSPTQLAHRTSYEVFVGPIPAGLQIDHLCRVRACVNPEHLEPVTPRENTRRSPLIKPPSVPPKAECKHGHPFTDENTRVNARGHRFCRECNKRRCRKYKAARADRRVTENHQ